VLVSARDSLIPLPFLGLAGQAGKAQKGKGIIESRVATNDAEII
jgi:hypothetical protein